jgi:predicted transcriptional regulator
LIARTDTGADAFSFKANEAENFFKNMFEDPIDLGFIGSDNELLVTGGGPADPVLAFVDRFIESVEHLEILLLLAAHDRNWSVAEIFQRIQSSQASVEQRLQTLVAAGLLSKDANSLYRFTPKDPETQKLVNDLAEAYKTRRVRVIEAIYTRKTDAVRTFADAFKFRKD